MHLFNRPILKDESFIEALHRREMKVENRINKVRVAYFLLFAFMDSVVGFQQYQLGSGMIFVAGFAMLMIAGFTYFIHRYTRGPVYYPWVKYLSVTFDFAFLSSAFVAFQQLGHLLPVDLNEKLAHYFQGEWSILFALMFILINLASGLRFGRSIVLYSTTLTLVVNGYILYTGNVAGQLLLYTMIVSTLSGVLTYFISENISQLFTKFLQRKRLKRFLSKDLIARLDAGEIDLELGGEKRVVTVLISDLRGFTTFSEGKDPQFIVKVLNEYLTEMTNVIFKHGGTIDKFLGDGILAVFGAPLDIDEHGVCAVRAAIEMQTALEDLNTRWGDEGHTLLKMGIGLHTGKVLVGNIGSPERMEYTVIGDTVNLASRIEGLTKTLACPVLFSEQVQSLIEGEIRSVFVTETQVRGRDGLARLYSV